MLDGLWMRHGRVCASKVGMGCGVGGDWDGHEVLLACGQVRQTGQPPLAGGWSVRGAKGSVARMRHCA